MRRARVCSQGGVQFSVNAGTPSGATDIFLTGFNQAPPPACARVRHEHQRRAVRHPPADDGRHVRDGDPASRRSQSSGKKWWQTEVCLGTNLRFITKLNSLANLRPGATPVGGGRDVPLPGRWWGVLPSIPRLHAPAEHRLGSRPVGQPPLGSCQRRRRDQVRRPVRRELDVADRRTGRRRTTRRRGAASPTSPQRIESDRRWGPQGPQRRCRALGPSRAPTRCQVARKSRRVAASCSDACGPSRTRASSVSASS